MSFQVALCIHESPRDRSDLLLFILQFLADSPKELSKIREVSREFKLCVDFMILQQVRSLVGPQIKPIQGQSNGEVLAAAMQLDEVSREWLRGWDANSSRDLGFEVGIVSEYTRRRCQYDKIGKSVGVIALIPCYLEVEKLEKKNSSPSKKKILCNVPVGIQFNQVPKKLSRLGEKINNALLAEKFLHMNRDDNGEFNLGKNITQYRQERTLDCTLFRIQKDLQSYTVSAQDIHCALSAILHSEEYGGSDKQYKKYARECLVLFESFTLGERLPNLNIFEIAVENAIRLNKVKKDYEVKMETSFKQANLKLEKLEKKVNKKFTTEEMKRKVHMSFIVIVGGLALLEKLRIVQF